MELKHIINQCLQKDRAAEKLLYLKFVKKIYGICRRYSVDDHQAEDYMQEGFMKAFQNLVSYDPGKGNFEGWLVRIVINTILSEKRHHKNKRKEEFLDLADDSLIAAEESDESALQPINSIELLEAIRKLPIQYRDVLNLFVFENLTHQEIASLMSIQVSSSRSRLTRAKKMLRHILSEKLITIS